MHSVGGAIGIGGVLPQNSVGGSFAFGTEFVTDGGLENWTDDTPDDWTEEDESAGVRDITKETTEIHGGSAAAKLEATLNDGTSFYITQIPPLQSNKFYTVSGWIYFPTRTLGNITFYIWTDEDQQHWIAQLSSTNAEYTHYTKIITLTGVTGILIVCRILDETTTGIVYFDDISVRDVDLIARHYGGTLIGAIGMQQIDLWDKWSTN